MFQLLSIFLLLLNTSLFLQCSGIPEGVTHTPSIISSPSTSKRRLKLAKRRVVSSSRETTPEEYEPMKKRGRFEPGSDDTAVPSPSIDQRRVGTLASAPDRSGVAVHRVYYPGDTYRRPPATTRESTEEGLVKNLNRSFGKQPFGPEIPSALPNRSISQAAISARPKPRPAPTKSDRRVELLEKRIDANDHNISGLKEDLKEMKDLLRHRINQDRIDSNHRLKIQQELSKIHKTTEQQSTASQDLILGLRTVRTDIDDLRLYVVGKPHPNMSPTNLTHIVLGDSMGGSYLDFEVCNDTAQ